MLTKARKKRLWELARSPAQVWARYQLWRRSCLAFLPQRPPAAIPPDFDDLWFLYRLIRTRRPKTVLEFGSGCSTAVIANALQHNSSGHLYSLEVDPVWAQWTRRCLAPSLMPWVDLQVSRLTRTTYRNIAVFRHLDIPAISPDIVYLDSPPLTADCRVAVDPVDLELRLKPGSTLIVDGRRANVAFLQNHLRHRYHIWKRWAPWGSTIFDLKEVSISEAISPPWTNAVLQGVS